MVRTILVNQNPKQTVQLILTPERPQDTSFLDYYKKKLILKHPQNLNEWINGSESSKISELRQNELKLRRLEKDLSLREKLLNENSKDRTRLETYDMKLEACNQ